MVEFIKSKKEMSEEDIKANFITPAIVSKGWKNGEHIAYEEYFTDGRIEVRGDKARRKEGKKSDYSLYYQFGTRIAIVEAKDNKHSVRAGLQQAIEYGEILDVPFVYSSNGDGFIEHDRITREERELELDEFPTREELFSRMTKEKGLTYEITEAISTPYYTDAFSMKTPRYYQQIAINRTIETVARGQKRVMFVMATGTGKTFMAFQIIHRLRKAGLAKRVLFLADRNILVDQTMAEDFRPFEKVMTKITPKLLTAPEKLNSFEIYLGLYQQLTGEDGTETHYQKFDKDFFDLIVIDEAHRGSAKENSNWRKVIDYFSSATQIGMTATPKETKNASNTEYFGEPIYTYSLKQGIEDGFLAPYRVMRVNLDVDVKHYGKFADGSTQEIDVPYDIPDTWEWVRIKSIYWNFGQNKPEKSFRYIDTSSIDRKKNIINYKNLQYLSPEQAPSRARKLVSQNSVLFSTVRPYLKNIAVVRELKEYLIASTAFIVLDTLLNETYLKYYLLSDNFINRVNNKSTGTSYPAINDYNFNLLLIALPPLSEQQRIVEAIESALEKVDEYAESYNRLEQLDKEFPDKLKKSILQYAMQGKLVEQDPNDESVEVLLEKIRAEKQKLFEEGKIKKKDLDISIVSQ
ncbi:TPA: EcoAI/FtnUII family type I restriction enzme subunit R, partial [Streptococcus pneumoniae]